MRVIRHQRITAKAGKEHSVFVKGDIILTMPTAEMVNDGKHIPRHKHCGCQRVAQLAEKFGVDVWEIPRQPVTRVNILKPGPGVGGHCKRRSMVLVEAAQNKVPNRAAPTVE